MPTILRMLGFRFFFYSNEGNEPVHIHVEKGEATAKYWLDPISEAYNRRFTKAETRNIIRIIGEHQDHFKQQWDEYFNS